MARPSTNTDRKLIEAGKCVLFEHGFSGLTLRAVAQRAKVNLGMFAYHFKDKDDFLRQVSQEAYEEFYGKLILSAEDKEDPKEALCQALRVTVHFIRDHRQTLLVMLKDINNKHPEAIRFAKKNLPRHAIFFLGLIRRCRKEGRIQSLPLGVLVSFILGSLMAPNLIFSVAEGAVSEMPLLRPVLLIAKSEVMSDKAIEQRLDLVFKAISKESKQ
jgi:AcrR family transcriptional regulator